VFYLIFAQVFTSTTHLNWCWSNWTNKVVHCFVNTNQDHSPVMWLSVNVPVQVWMNYTCTGMSAICI